LGEYETIISLTGIKFDLFAADEIAAILLAREERIENFQQELLNSRV